MNNEEYVRSVWGEVEDFKGRGEYVAIRHDSELSSNWHSWAAAAEFTRERLEQVRQLREEIDDIDNYCSPQALRKWMETEAPKVDAEYVRNYATGYARRNRTVSRLESELTRLTAGMKGTA